MLGEQNTQLLIEPIIGWRTWSVRKENGQPSFISPFQQTVWDRGSLNWNGVCGCEKTRTATQRQIDKFQAALDMLNSHAEVDTHPELIEQKQKAMQRLAEAGDADQCHCGINAFSLPGQVLDDPIMNMVCGHAIGQVALSGLVRGYEYGWRAERAQIVRVWTGAMPEADPKLVRAAAEAAGAQYMGRVDDVWLGAWRGQGEP